MQVVPEIVLALGMVVIGIPTDGILNRRRPDSGVAPAMVRFVNNTMASATLSANGQRLFDRIPTGRVTDYVELRDSAVAFTLVAREPQGEPVSILEKLTHGARYTITARGGQDAHPELMILREDPAGTTHTPW